jgi:hypothetical protein
MKKLHLTTGKDDLRSTQKHIQIKGGFVLTTNSHVLVKFPLNEVFGENNPFNQDSEFYILGTDWKKQGFDKALSFATNGNNLEAYDKKYNLLGIIKMLDLPEFKSKHGNYPNIDQVLPTSELGEVSKIGLNPGLLKDLCDCLGAMNFKFEFRGENKIIMIKCNDSEAIGGIMPMAISW